jgi:hypothetical protein
LADLGLAGRIVLGARRIEVRHRERTADRRLNNVLSALATAAPPLSPQEWLRTAPRTLTTEYLSRLEDSRTVRVRRSRERGGRTRTEILEVDLTRRQAVQDRMDALAGQRRDPAAPAPGDADLALAALVVSCGLDAHLYPGLRGRPARRRLARAGGAGTAVPAADAEAAEAVETGAAALTRGLSEVLSDFYSTTTTGGSGLGHDLDPGGWGLDGHPGGGHHSAGHHDGGHHGGGDC